MKKILVTCFALALGILVMAGLTGCVVTKDKQVLEKSTVFGFQAKTPGAPSGGSLLIQVGLVRNEYWSNPTSTNALTAAPYNSTVHANLAAFNQAADENYGTYQLPTNAYAPPAVSTSVPATAVTTNASAIGK